MNAQQFRRLTGYKPVNDDLDRVNCVRAGHLMHQQCGVHRNTGMPKFMPNSARRRKPMPLTPAGLNLRTKRYWKSGWKLKRRGIRQLITAMDANINWQNPVHAHTIEARLYQHVEKPHVP